MKTIVSISPTRVEADSRTFKQAASISRFGFNSIVVEGQRSSLEKSKLPFELYTLANGTGSRDGYQADVSQAQPAAKDTPKDSNTNFKRFLSGLGIVRVVQYRHTIRFTLRSFVDKVRMLTRSEERRVGKECRYGL